MVRVAKRGIRSAEQNQVWTDKAHSLFRNRVLYKAFLVLHWGAGDDKVNIQATVAEGGISKCVEATKNKQERIR